MSFNALDTHTLLGIMQKVKKFDPLFLMLFFPNAFAFETEEIMFDKLTDETVDLAAFVSPEVAGKILHDRGGELRAFKPAYVKPKHEVTNNHKFQRKAGEAIGGSVSPAARRLATLADHMRKQDALILHREEWMAVQVVLFGSVIVEGDGYPTQQVDYQRSADNQRTLIGGAKWDTVDPLTYDPTEDIENWADHASGTVDIIIMSAKNWSLFRTFKGVKEELERRHGSTSRLKMAPADLGKIVSSKGFFGEVEILVYKGEYIDPKTKVKTRFVPDEYIVLGSTGHNGVRAYGAIKDAELNANGLFEGERAPKHWLQKGDPAGEFTMTQCAPLPVPENGDADAFVVIKTH